MKHIKHYFQSKGWGQNSTFSEDSHVAYQTKENDKCSMVANILPADSYLTSDPGIGVKRSKYNFFRTCGHAA